MYDFSVSVKHGSIERTGWYNLQQRDHWTETLGCIAYGYPTEINSIYEHPDEIKLQCFAASGKYCGPTIGELHGMQLNSPMTIDPDGMSGGPVFFLIHDNLNFEIIPAGIVTNASRSVINFVPASKLQRFLSKDLVS